MCARVCVCARVTHWLRPSKTPRGHPSAVSSSCIYCTFEIEFNSPPPTLPPPNRGPGSPGRPSVYNIRRTGDRTARSFYCRLRCSYKRIVPPAVRPPTARRPPRSDTYHTNHTARADNITLRTTIRYYYYLCVHGCAHGIERNPEREHGDVRLVFIILYTISCIYYICFYFAQTFKRSDLSRAHHSAELTIFFLNVFFRPGLLFHYIYIYTYILEGWKNKNWSHVESCPTLHHRVITISPTTEY